MEYTIAQVAEMKGVSERAVYKQLKTHEEELKGHITKRQGKMWLDEEAYKVLVDASGNSPAVFVEDARVAEYEELKKKYEELEVKLKDRDDLISQMSKKLLEIDDKAIEMKTANELLIEEKGALKFELATEKGRVEILETELNRFQKTVFGLYKKK